MKITIIYDNKQFLEDWESGWGFSALIENNNNERLLFDTGDNSDKLLRNINKTGIDVESINAVTFSHADWDHKDGAEGFLKVNKTAYVYIPHSFPEEFRNMVEQSGHNYTLTGYSKNELIKNVFSTPSYAMAGRPEESGLVIKMKDGIVLITGCAHPGILNMARKVKGIFSMNISMIIGGFHLKDVSINAVENLIGDLKEEGIKRFAPCHCTGDRQIKVFEKMCGGDFIKVGSGKEIKFN